jgi:tetratricopeptide (TPR) repeat protein
MKKTVLILGLVILTGASYSQKKNRTSAIMAMKNGYTLKAKNYIDKAVSHEDTKEDPKTWYNYSKIYLDVMISDDEKLAEFKESSLKNILTGLKNTIKYDKKDDYKSDIKLQVSVIYSMSLQQGIAFYQDKNYKDALLTFKSSQEFANIIGAIDSVGIFNSAISAKAMGDDATAIKYYEKCVEIGYAGSDPYFNLISLYSKIADKEGAEAIIKKARAAYPSDANILLEQTRFYIEAGQSEKAEKDLISVVEKDPTNVTLRHALGVVYEQIGKSKLAVESYKKGLEIDPEHVNCTKNLGLVYNTMAAEINEKLGDVPLDDQETYDKMIKERDDNLKIGLPYLEKSYATKQDSNLKRVLNSVYRVLKIEKTLD